MDLENVKLHLREYVEMITEHGRNQRDQYICPFCGSGTGPHGTGAFTVFPDHHFKCFSCGETGDIFDLIEKHEHLTKAEATRRALDLFGAPSGSFRAPEKTQVKTDRPRIKARQPVAPSEEWQRLAEKIMQRAAEVIFSTDGDIARNYLYSRGIDDQTIKEMYIGYIPYTFDILNPVPKDKRRNPDRNRLFVSCGITFPYVINGKIFRLEMRKLPQRIRKGENKIMQLAEGQPAALFNADAAACRDKYRDIVFTEGVIDALSIIQTVARHCNDEITAVTFGSADYKGDYMQYFEHYVMPRRILIGLDNDDAGKTNAEKLKAEIQKARSKIGVREAGIFFPKPPYKDWNEYLQKEPETFFGYISDRFPV